MTPSKDPPSQLLRRFPAGDPTGASSAGGRPALRIQILTVVLGGAWLLVLVVNALTDRPWLDVLPTADELDLLQADLVGIGLGILAVLGALAVFFLARRPNLTENGLSRLGLAFGVLGAFLIAIVENQVPLTAEGTRGMSSSAVWILGFPLLVACRPPGAAIAVALSIAATPLALLFWAALGIPLPETEVVFAWTFPVITTGVIAIIPVVIMTRISDLARAAQQAARRMGSYQLERRLGAGGMGEVWVARHQLLARPAAIKVVNVARLGIDPAAARTALARFEREAQVTATLRSPHTVELYDFGVSDDGSAYYVMELLDGIDLDMLVERFGPQPPERVVHLLQQACASLAEAHRRQLVHRDIKPANLFVTLQAFVPDVLKVLDFGLVKHEVRLGNDKSLTQVGGVAGTPAFMAPEQALADGQVDGRADLYALGCVAWWLLTGELVFREETAIKLVLAHVQKQPPVEVLRAAEVGVPEPLVQIVLRCLAKDPAARPPSAEALAAALGALEIDTPWTRERAQLWWDRHQPGARAEAAPAAELAQGSTTPT